MKQNKLYVEITCSYVSRKQRGVSPGLKDSN